MQDVKSTTIHSRSFDERILTKSWRSIIHILVVNLPMNKSTTCQTIAFQEVAPHSKEIEKPRTRAKKVSLKWEQVMLWSNEEKTSSIYMILMTFN